MVEKKSRGGGGVEKTLNLINLEFNSAHFKFYLIHFELNLTIFD